MATLRRILAVPVLLLALAGIIACGVVAVGVWKVRSGLAERVERAADEVEKGIDRTRDYLGTGEDILSLAIVDAQDVVKTTATGEAPDPARVAAVRKLARDKVLKKLAPEIDTLSEGLTALTGTLRVVNGVISDVNRLPFASLEDRAEKNLGSLESRLNRLTLAVQDLKAAVNDEQPVNNSMEGLKRPAGHVDAALREIQTETTEWMDWLIRLSQRLEKLKGDVDRWFLIGAITISVAFAWFAFAQVSLLVHAWSWVRGKGSCE